MRPAGKADGYLSLMWVTSTREGSTGRRLWLSFFAVELPRVCP